MRILPESAWIWMRREKDFRMRYAGNIQLWTLYMLFGLSAMGQSTISAQDAEQALSFHNTVRKLVGSPPLLWSDSLASYAQGWADQLALSGCQIRHRPRSGPWAQQHGENIFGGWGKIFTAMDASKAWYSEISTYQHIPLKESNVQRTGHYTQMVWKRTRLLGMGQASCPDGTTVIVANYDPPGNFLGQYPY